jgi:hypothetical protein
MNLALNKRFQVPVLNLSKIKDKDLRRLIAFGMHFVIISVEKRYEKGILHPESDVITITTSLDHHGSWKFERNDLIGVLNVEKGKT